MGFAQRRGAKAGLALREKHGQRILEIFWFYLFFSACAMKITSSDVTYTDVVKSNRTEFAQRSVLFSPAELCEPDGHILPRASARKRCCGRRHS
jgi:hypothetical protein